MHAVIYVGLGFFFNMFSGNLIPAKILGGLKAWESEAPFLLEEVNKLEKLETVMLNIFVEGLICRKHVLV